MFSDPIKLWGGWCKDPREVKDWAQRSPSLGATVSLHPCFTPGSPSVGSSELLFCVVLFRLWSRCWILSAPSWGLGFESSKAGTNSFFLCDSLCSPSRGSAHRLPQQWGKDKAVQGDTELGLESSYYLLHRTVLKAGCMPASDIQ